jgi:hypothetical protein
MKSKCLRCAGRRLSCFGRIERTSIAKAGVKKQPSSRRCSQASLTEEQHHSAGRAPQLVLPESSALLVAPALGLVSHFCAVYLKNSLTIGSLSLVAIERRRRQHGAIASVVHGRGDFAQRFLRGRGPISRGLREV